MLFLIGLIQVALFNAWTSYYDHQMAMNDETEKEFIRDFAKKVAKGLLDEVECRLGWNSENVSLGLEYIQ